MIFTVQATPGPRAGASFMASEDGRQLLLIDLDPVQVWLEVPPVTAGPGVMAVFLRQLARQSVLMSERLDAMAAELGGQMTDGRPRHRSGGELR